MTQLPKHPLAGLLPQQQRVKKCICFPSQEVRNPDMGLKAFFTATDNPPDMALWAGRLCSPEGQGRDTTDRACLRAGAGDLILLGCASWAPLACSSMFWGTWCWGHSSEQNGKKPCPHGLHILVGCEWECNVIALNVEIRKLSTALKTVSTMRD